MNKLNKLIGIAENSACLSSITQNQLEAISSHANSILLDPAYNLGLARRVRMSNIRKRCHQRQKKECKPWFNETCERQRKEYLNLKQKAKRQKTPFLISKLKRMSKEYKALIRQTARRYYEDLHVSLRNMRTVDPKAYWKLINEGSGTGPTRTAIPVQNFFDHFSRMNEGTNEGERPGSQPDKEPSGNSASASRPILATDLDLENLNRPFSLEELRESIQVLKNSKAAGIDGIVNEFLKNCPLGMQMLIVRWFNVVLDSGIVPENWCIGIITPIYKGKGARENPDNYRGITLLSCVGKLFTSLINKRLSYYIESNKIIGPEQAGFRHGFSTMDHVFTLHCVLTYYLSQRKRIFAAFLDYKKAFDPVDRCHLWGKLLK